LIKRAKLQQICSLAPESISQNESEGKELVLTLNIPVEVHEGTM